jgi:hypothetical protein
VRVESLGSSRVAASGEVVEECRDRVQSKALTPRLGLGGVEVFALSREPGDTVEISEEDLRASHMHYAPQPNEGKPYGCQVEGCSKVAKTYCSKKEMMLCEEHSDSKVIEGLVFE